jgi:hypothetical protein
MATTRISITVILLAGLAHASALGQEVIVKGSDETDRPVSEFLRPPGSSTDPYAPAVDWTRIPPWRQTEFFGIRAQGKTFLYVVDCSGSMDVGDRLIRAKREIRRGVSEMKFPQRFEIIFYNDRPRVMPGGVPQSADYATRMQLSQWLDLIDADGGTDPRAAMTMALGQKPDAVFLLSDGEFPPDTVAAIAKANKGKTPIHCVDFSGKSDDLKAIAKGSGGQYASRP